MLINRFETVLADTETSREIHYNVRYRVFCEETGFEDADRFPDQQERDDCDDRAEHFIVWDRLTNRWVGAMRLVDASSAKLPCEQIIGNTPDGLELNRDRAREFSRLCILSECRQTSSSMFFGLAAPDCNPHGQRTPVFFSQTDHEILLRLLRATFRWSISNDVDYCYFLARPALARIFKRFGIPMAVVGSPVEHRGSRIPYRYDVHEAEVGMTKNTPSFARLIRNSRPYVPYSEFVRDRADTVTLATMVLPRLEVQANRHEAA